MVDLHFQNTDLQQLTELEWLVTNGIGGYASGTVSGVLTRRYHGLLVAALKPPVGRVNTVVKLDEWAKVDGITYPLFANQWHSAEDPLVPPTGCSTLTRFFLDGQIPTWRYQLGDVTFEKKIWMEQGKNSTILQFSNLSSSTDVDLTLKAMLGYTNFHFTNKKSTSLDLEEVHGGIRVKPTSGGTDYFIKANGDFKLRSIWLGKFFLALEDYRGLDALTDLFNGADIILTIPPGDVSQVTLTTEESGEQADLEDFARRKAYEAKLYDHLPAKSLPEWAVTLPLAANQFIVKRSSAGIEGHSIVAGYHWFSDWGRDTMISLPGLTLSTGRFEVAESILRTYGEHIDGGMLPNRFPDLGEEPIYNTIDATLWYFEAIYQFFKKMLEHDPERGKKLVQDLFPKLEEIIRFHEIGTRYQIRVDDDGLIYGGEEGVQLTWMDAKVDGFVVTPRIGKPVEINGLWYSALRCMADFAELLGYENDVYLEKARIVKSSFSKYWNEKKGYCYDVIEGPNGNEDALRPNQILAAAVAFSPLTQEQMKMILSVCEKELFTKFGLRSLGPDEEGFVSTYGGDIWQRDSSYHQGTVWGWLMGPFLVVDYKINHDKEKVLKILEEYCQGLSIHGLGSISEIFDAEPPHHSRGCIAQAWSVAAALWVLDQVSLH